jgi:predicted Zn-dependent protease
VRRGGVRWWVILLFGGYLMYYWFSHQEESAFTGRERLIESSMEQEAALGVQAFDQILSTERVVTSGPLPALVEDIMQRLVTVAPALETALVEGREDAVKTEWDAFDWEVRVLQSEQANAFCLPGGKMAVYTGIVEVAQNDDALAAIMGHEIAHALLRHGGERMAHQKLVQVGAVAAGVAVGDMEPQQQRMVLAALGAGAQYGVLLPFSRNHETEADFVGLMLSAAACYEPREAITLWERMGEAAGGRSPPEFMSTHPGHGTRIQQLQEWMPQAQAVRERFCAPTAR